MMFLSSGEFYRWLSSFQINLGTALAIIVVVGGFIVSIYKMKQSYDKMVGEKTKSDLETKETLESVNTLVNSVNTLKDEIIEEKNHRQEQQEEINTKMDNITQLIKAERELSKKGDEELKAQMTAVSCKVDVIDTKTNLLIESDKEGIKGDITECYYKSIEQGYIEIHTLETMEARYEKYLEENGNTFVSGIMQSLRELPNTKPKPVKKTTTSTRKKTTNA